MGRSSSSPARAPARPGSSSSASGWLLETRRRTSLPEQLLVLTYNVKAARSSRTRIDAGGRRRDRARMTVSNFHSFCQRVLTENAADAGLPPRPDVLDGVGQVLLLKDIRPTSALVYHGRTGGSATFVQFINRAKDELVTPGRLRRLRRRGAAGLRGPIRQLRGRCRAPRHVQGNLKPLRDVRGAYAGVRAERARRGARRGARLRPERRREGRRPRGPPDDRRRPARAHGRSQFAARRPCRASTRSPRPTSPTAPRSRSCG